MLCDARRLNIYLFLDPDKKVKIITFQDGVHNDSMALTSILLKESSSSGSPTSSTWDTSSTNPPNKRQCRSMSIPNDGQLQSRWLQTQSRGILHRPLALRPNSASSRSKSHQGSHHRSLLVSRLPPGWSSLARSDTSTPPESPRSRPSSASSGYYESPLASSSNLNNHRCESLQTLPSMEHGGDNDTSSANTGLPMRVIAAKSMPSVADFSYTSNSRDKLLRCQSQPCVIHERRCGVKRRRDEPRPSINFSKMAEV